MRFLYVIVCLLFSLQICSAQQIDTNVLKMSNPAKMQADTFYNHGKVVAKKAIRKSMILPGLGQLYNYKLIVDDIEAGRRKGKGVGDKIINIGKFVGIYTAGYLLTQSYIENNNNYKMFLKELQYRRLNQGKPDPNGQLSGYRTEEELYTGKAIYKNNREVVLIGLGLTYGVNILDAFITARLNYLNVDDRLSVKVSPNFIQQQPMLGTTSYAPGFKMSFKF